MIHFVFGYHLSIKLSAGITRFEQLFCLSNFRLLNNKWMKSMLSWREPKLTWTGVVMYWNILIRLTKWSRPVSNILVLFPVHFRQWIWRSRNKSFENLKKDMEQRLQQAKDNVTKMNAIMETWSESPLFVRKMETKVLGLLSLNDRNDRVKTRYDMITKNGEEIHQLIQQNAGFFKVRHNFQKVRFFWKAIWRHNGFTHF